MNTPRKFREPRDPDEVAARIRAARAWAGLTRPELAERMGRSKSTIERMEKGDRSALGGGYSGKLARILHDVALATGVHGAFFLEDWDAMTERREKEMTARLGGQRLEQRLARIEGALGIAPTELPAGGDDLDDVDLGRLLDSGDEPEVRDERS